MDFTEIYKQSNSLVEFSPGAQFLLTAAEERIIVRRTDTLQITRTWQIDPSQSPTQSALSSSQTKLTKSYTPVGADSWITHIGWSCDSEYILAACAKRGVVHVLKLRDEAWNGRIDAGTEGLVKAQWAPDGRTIVCWSEWGLRVTFWSLVTGSATYIQYPIHTDRGFGFRSDGRVFILAERHKSKETLGVYDASNSYKLLRASHFPLPTISLSSFAISPNGTLIAVWDGPLEFKLHVYSLTGSLITSFTPDSDPGFGIRRVTWHPSGAFLAVAGWEDRIYILDCLSWLPVALLDIASRVPSGTAIWREPVKWLEATEGRGFLTYERFHGLQIIPTIKTDLTKPHPKAGPLQLEWNLTGSILLVRLESMPTSVHLFDFPSPEQQFTPRLRSVLLHNNPVLHVRWNPVRKGSLALCSGGSCVYLWNDEWVNDSGEEEEVAECIGVPAKKFETKDLRWSPDGKGLVLLDKDQFCCAFEVEE